MYLALANSSRDPVLRSSRMRHLLWKDEAGGAIAFHVHRERIEYVTTFFEAPEPSVWNVATSGPAIDEACEHASGADCAVLDDEAETRLVTAVQWLYYAPYDRYLRHAQVLNLEVVGFASAVRAYADRGELMAAEAWPEDVDADNRAELFYATGLSQGAPSLSQRARATIGGEVESVDHRTSGLTKEPFVAVRLQTGAGPLNVVANPDTVTGSLAAGRWAWCDVWLVGRPTEPPPKTGLVGWLMS